MPSELIERARISFWWPTSGHPVWSEPVITHRKATGPTGREGAHTWTYCFPSVAIKTMVLRKYRLLRELGATPIAARWAINTECQRMFNTETIATFVEPDGTRVEPPVPMAFFPPSPCPICDEFGHDENDEEFHPYEGDDYGVDDD